MRLLVLGGTRFVGRAVVEAALARGRVDEADLAAAGARPWTQLPCWVPEAGEDAGIFEGDASKALAAGLTVRPVEQTVADTWEWVQQAGVPRGRPGMEPGLPEELERVLLQ